MRNGECGILLPCSPALLLLHPSARLPLCEIPLQRFAERKINLHRPFWPPVGGGVGAGGRGGHMAHGRWGGFVVRHAHIHRPQHVVAIHFHLVNGLVGATVAQLGRAVGREEQEGNLRHFRFDKGGVKIGGGRARGANDGHRFVGGQGTAERKKGGTALV